jgi:hypothetical protein
VQVLAEAIRALPAVAQGQAPTEDSDCGHWWSECILAARDEGATDAYQAWRQLQALRAENARLREWVAACPFAEER